MIKEQINTLIKESMIAKDKTKTEVLRAVKTAFVNYSTQKNAKPLDDAIEIQIIKKMVQQREDTAEQYKNAGRVDLSEIELSEAKILKEFLPAIPSKEDIEAWLENNNYHSIEKKEMGLVIKEVKSNFPAADGKLVAEIVKNLVV
jgi:uncharacterized protein YqeY